MWDRDQPVHHSDTTSESGLSSTSSGGGSVRSTRSNGLEIQTPNGKRIIGNPSGPTIITVSGMGSNHPYDSMLFNSIDEPLEAASGVTLSSTRGGGEYLFTLCKSEILNGNILTARSFKEVWWISFERPFL